MQKPLQTVCIDMCGTHLHVMVLSLTYCNSVPIFLPELHRLTFIQVPSFTHDALQLHLQDTSGDEKHNDMHENAPNRNIVFLSYYI